MAQLEIAPDFGLRGFRRALAIGAAAIALTSFFVVTGFPYDRLAPRVASGLEALTGARVTVGQLELRMKWILPQLRASNVAMTWPDGRSFTFDRMGVHPAVSGSWLRGVPALQIALRSALGEADGVLVAGNQPAFDGELRDVALSLLPLDDFAPGSQLDGIADATIDVQLAETGPEGQLHIDAKDGSLTLPMLPIGVPFDKLSTELDLGGDQLAKLASLDLSGPLVLLTGSGTIGRGPTTALSPLALQARIEAREPAMRSMLQSQGLALDANGGVTLTIDGTLGAPNLMPARPGNGRSR